MLILAIAALPLLGGCETNNAASRSDRYTSYRIDPGAQPSRSDRSSAARNRRPRGEAARYEAGMNAHHRGRLDEAARLLDPLTGSANPLIAGRANATLGLIHAARSQYSQAALRFRRAIRTLRGPDLARAYYHLALTEQKMGREESARTHFRMAMDKSRDAAFDRTIRQRMGMSGYALQVGAFSKRSNAEQQARAMRSAAASRSLGTPRVVPSTTASGSRLYLVRIGRFESFQAALDARRRLDRPKAIITPTDE